MIFDQYLEALHEKSGATYSIHRERVLSFLLGHSSFSCYDEVLEPSYYAPAVARLKIDLKCPNSIQDYMYHWISSLLPSYFPPSNINFNLGLQISAPELQSQQTSHKLGAQLH